MKVHVMINATTLPGKGKEARQAMLKTVEYLRGNNNYLGKYEIIHPVGGPNNSFTWLCTYASMADYEKDVEMRGKDAEWGKVFAGVDETVDVDNISATIYRVAE
jgi:hypothetical protein